MYLEGDTITFTFYNYSWLGPTFQNRYRPLTYYTDLSSADRMDGGNRNSFYSGHVASVAAAMGLGLCWKPPVHKFPVHKTSYALTD
jgi:hypothetical protein